MSQSLEPDPTRAPQWRPGKRVVKVYQYHLAAPPEAVFPLLCPVREYEWIPTWSCVMIYASSGVAEAGCVFQTDFPAMGPATWVVTRYQPPLGISFAIFYPELLVECLELDLAPAPQGCQLTWRRAYTSLGPRGQHFLEQELDGLFATVMAAREQDLRRYLAEQGGGARRP